ncbi:MAG: hypothetical protein ACRDTA_24390 [Pseudonocardiaceae bacterium]
MDNFDQFAATAIDKPHRFPVGQLDLVIRHWQALEDRRKSLAQVRGASRCWAVGSHRESGDQKPERFSQQVCVVLRAEA